MTLELLLATTNQTDDRLYTTMHAATDMVIANQCGRNDYALYTHGDNRVKLISTDTRGVGINRNIGLLASRADILLFSDDDIVYYDGYEKGVLGEFERHPECDAVIFGIDFSRNGVPCGGTHFSSERAHLYNSLVAGTSMLAIRRRAYLRHNLSFNQMFGGGCEYSCGEDTIFITECFKHHLKIRKSAFVLGTTAMDESSWFSGYTEKFYADKGALLARAFPVLCPLMAFYFARSINKKAQTGYFYVLRHLLRGIRAYKKSA